jgi:hypothetical protein
MSKTNDGGPAFPRCNTPDIVSGGWTDGMTLRDYFAAAALQAFSSDSFRESALKIAERNRPATMNSVMAEIVYEMADAMLAERERGQQ